MMVSELQHMLTSNTCLMDITGTGISDGFPTGGVDAHESNKFFAQLPYDVLAIGK